MPVKLYFTYITVYESILNAFVLNSVASFVLRTILIKNNMQVLPVYNGTFFNAHSTMFNEPLSFEPTSAFFKNTRIISLELCLNIICYVKYFQKNTSLIVVLQ